MYGAVIGDLAGSKYEYAQAKEIKPVRVRRIIEDDSFYSDDTILTIAVLDAILHDRDYEKYLRKYIHEYMNYKPNFKPYFDTAFSPGLIRWSTGNTVGCSRGNGAMMRISPVGYLFDTEEDVIENARLATIPSHNSKEAVDAATKIALIIFYLRKGLTKEEIFEKLNIEPKYRTFTKFNTRCFETIDNCISTFNDANSFEGAINRILLLGGDTDTNACIVGSMAEALHGVKEDLIKRAEEKIPEEFVKVLRKGYERIRK